MSREQLVVRRMDVRNVSGETIPAFGVMKITNAVRHTNDMVYMEAEKPDGEDGVYHLNGRYPVEDDGFATLNVTYPGWALYDTQVPAPINGEEWGPVDGQWHISDGGSGFKIIGLAESGRIVVDRQAVGRGSEIIHFEVAAVGCGEYDDDFPGEKYLDVNWTWYSGGCGDPPGIEYDGTIRVWDVAKHLLDLVNGDVVGAKGTAIYMRDTESCMYNWILDDIVPPAECAGSGL